MEEFLYFKITRVLLGELGFGGSTEAQLGIMFVLLLADLVEEKVSLMLVLKAKEKPVLKAKKIFIFSRTKPSKVLLDWEGRAVHLETER